jgi:hypothetical protein
MILITNRLTYIGVNFKRPTEIIVKEAIKGSLEVLVALPKAKVSQRGTLLYGSTKALERGARASGIQILHSS